MRLRLILYLLLLSLMLWALFVAGKSGIREYVIIDAPDGAVVWPYPNAITAVGNLKKGEKIAIYGKKEGKNGLLGDIWYKIRFNGMDGWIIKSQTTGDIIVEESINGKKNIQNIPYNDSTKIVRL